MDRIIIHKIIIKKLVVKTLRTRRRTTKKHNYDQTRPWHNVTTNNNEKSADDIETLDDKEKSMLFIITRYYLLHTYSVRRGLYF